MVTVGFTPHQLASPRPAPPTLHPVSIHHMVVTAPSCGLQKSKGRGELSSIHPQGTKEPRKELGILFCRGKQAGRQRNGNSTEVLLFLNGQSQGLGFVPSTF